MSISTNNNPNSSHKTRIFNGTGDTLNLLLDGEIINIPQSAPEVHLEQTIRSTNDTVDNINFPTKAIVFNKIVNFPNPDDYDIIIVNRETALIICHLFHAKGWWKVRFPYEEASGATLTYQSLGRI